MESKTEIGPRNPDFRSSLNSRHSPMRRSRPKSANKRHHSITSSARVAKYAPLSPKVSRLTPEEKHAVRDGKTIEATKEDV
jgi:hypothetical protein